METAFPFGYRAHEGNGTLFLIWKASAQRLWPSWLPNACPSVGILYITPLDCKITHLAQPTGPPSCLQCRLYPVEATAQRNLVALVFSTLPMGRCPLDQGPKSTFPDSSCWRAADFYFRRSTNMELFGVNFYCKQICSFTKVNIQSEQSPKSKVSRRPGWSNIG